MCEALKVWQPIKDYVGELDLIELEFGRGLRISFHDEAFKKITFSYDHYGNEPYILTYRMTHEFKRDDLYQKTLNARKAFFNDDIGWALYKAQNSEYIQWYQQLPAITAEPVKHHLYISSEYVIDVLSTYEPNVTESIK